MDQPAYIPTGRAALLLAVVILAAASLVLLRWHEVPVGAATDDAYYADMARSLAEGRGPVIHLNEVAGPWPADVFPPGFSLLLAPLARISPPSLDLMKLVPLLAWMTLIPLCLAWPGRVASPGRRIALVTLVLINPWTIGYAGRVVSDLPYTALSLGALLGYRNWSARPTPGRFFLLILLTVTAVTVRTVGWALPAAMVLHLLMTRRWKRALAFLATCGLPLLAIHLWADPHGAGLFTGGYSAQVLQTTDSSRIALIVGNLLGYLAEIPALLFPVFGEPTRALGQGAGFGSIYDPVLMILGAGILVLVGLGWSRSRKTDYPDPVVLYAILYGLALVNFSGWPTGVQTRLLLPLLPLLLDGLLGWFEFRTAGRRRTPWLFPVVALCLLAALFHNGFRVARPPVDPRFDPGLGSAWLKQNSEVNDTVMVRMPLKQHLHLGRPTVGFGVLAEEALDIRVARFGVRWIVLGPEPLTGEAEPGSRSRAMAALMADRPAIFSLVASDPQGRFRIFRVATPTPGRTAP